MRSAALVLLAAAAAVAQDPSDGPDRVTLQTREELRGRIEKIDETGILLLRRGSRLERLPMEEVARVAFEAAPALQNAAGQRLHIRNGGQLTGTIEGFVEGVFTIQTAHGTFRVPRREVKTVSLAALDAGLPDPDEAKGDVLLHHAGGKTLASIRGTLVSIRDGQVVVKKGDAEETVELAKARVVYLQPEEGAKVELPSGWFTKVLFKNGDKIVGVAREFSGERVRIFSHLVGEAEFAKTAVHSVSFVPFARMSVGNIIVCDQTGVREYDRQGRQIWSYRQNVNYPWSATKLENGNVLIANTNFNQVVEVQPAEREGGRVVWQLDNVQYPYDAQRLPNGNTLVAEYYANTVAEYDARTKERKWSTQKTPYPISVQRLDNGNTLIASNYMVIELNAKDEEVWRAKVGGMRPWRATRLENGNTLIVDYQRGRVFEVTSDAKSEVVWKVESLSRPVSAVRLDDGNTLILEQGNNRVIEVDPMKKVTPLIQNLNYPLSMSTY